MQGNDSPTKITIVQAIGIILAVIAIIFLFIFLYKHEKANDERISQKRFNEVTEIILTNASSIAEKYSCSIDDIDFDSESVKNSSYHDVNYYISGYNKLSDEDKYEFAKELNHLKIQIETGNTKDVYAGMIIEDNKEYEYLGATLELNGTEIFRRNDSDTSSSSSSVPLTDDGEKATCWALAEKAVKNQLKSPSSAKFPFSYGSEGVSMFRTGSAIYVVAWVEAENDFGAMLRNDFAVTIEKSGSGKTAMYTVTDCAIG